MTNRTYHKIDRFIQNLRIPMILKLWLLRQLDVAYHDSGTPIRYRAIDLTSWGLVDDEVGYYNWTEFTVAVDSQAEAVADAKRLGYTAFRIESYDATEEIAMEELYGDYS